MIPKTGDQKSGLEALPGYRHGHFTRVSTRFLTPRRNLLQITRNLLHLGSSDILERDMIQSSFATVLHIFLESVANRIPESMISLVLLLFFIPKKPGNHTIR